MLGGAQALCLTHRISYVDDEMDRHKFKAWIITFARAGVKGGLLRNPGVYVKPCKPGLAVRPIG